MTRNRERNLRTTRMEPLLGLLAFSGVEIYKKNYTRCPWTEISHSRIQTAKSVARKKRWPNAPKTQVQSEKGENRHPTKRKVRGKQKRAREKVPFGWNGPNGHNGHPAKIWKFALESSQRTRIILHDFTLPPTLSLDGGVRIRRLDLGAQKRWAR